MPLAADPSAGNDVLKDVEKQIRTAGVTPDVLAVKGAGTGAQRVNLVSDPFRFKEVPAEQYAGMVTKQQTAAMGGDAGQNAKVVDFAKKFVDTPYKWGGSSPLGFDCSGFTQYVYKQVYGIDLPRVSFQQGKGGRAVGGDELQAGDLLFWDNSPRNPGADHVAIYIGNGQYIDAPKPGATVGIRTLKQSSGYWARRYT